MRYVQLHERCLCVLHLQSLGLQPDQKDCARSPWSCIQHFARILQKKSLSMSTNFTWECDQVLSSNNQTQQFHWMTWPVIQTIFVPEPFQSPVFGWFQNCILQGYRKKNKSYTTLHFTASDVAHSYSTYICN